MNSIQNQIANLVYQNYIKAEILTETTISSAGYTRTIREIKEILGAKNLKEVSVKYGENLKFR